MNQLHEIGSPERAEAWVRELVGRGERVMGFGHRVYRAYDPRAAALRTVAEQMGGNAEWLDMAVKVEDTVLRVLAELKPGRVLKTNVEYYAAAVMQGLGLSPPSIPRSSRSPATPAGPPMPSSRSARRSSSARTCATRAPRSATCRPEPGRGGRPRPLLRERHAHGLVAPRTTVASSPPDGVRPASLHRDEHAADDEHDGADDERGADPERDHERREQRSNDPAEVQRQVHRG